MRRNLLSGILAAALLPAASLWAAPNAVAPSAQYSNQIAEQARQIQTQADRLESYLRSGAHSANAAAGYTADMAESTQKLATLLDAYVAQPGTTNDTRQQVERMRVSVNELDAFIGSASVNLDSHAMGLHLDSILASISNIMDRGNMVRAAALTLGTTN
jgi:hypothetical protein